MLLSSTKSCKKCSYVVKVMLTKMLSTRSKHYYVTAGLDSFVGLLFFVLLTVMLNVTGPMMIILICWTCSSIWCSCRESLT